MRRGGSELLPHRWNPFAVRLFRVPLGLLLEFLKFVKVTTPGLSSGLCVFVICVGLGV